MNIVFENVDANRVFRTDGPGIRFEISDAGNAAVRVVLTIDDNAHVTFPSRRGDGRTVSDRKLEPGRHFASLVLAAHALDGGRRDYDTTIAINGTTVARAQGAIPDGSSDDSQIQLFQLRVR